MCVCACVRECVYVFALFSKALFIVDVADGWSKLSSQKYWDKFYEKEYDHQRQSFEWLFEYNDCKHVINQCLNKDHLNTVMDLGCGTSSLGVDMLTSIKEQIQMVLLDSSPKALSIQRERHNQSHHLRTTNLKKDLVSSKNDIDQLKTQPLPILISVDARVLPFKDGVFDVVIDKGTSDSLLKDRKGGTDTVRQIWSEVIRVLHPGGRMLQITDEDPDSRMALLDKCIRKRCDVEVTCSSLHTKKNNWNYFVYVISKK